MMGEIGWVKSWTRQVGQAWQSIDYCFYRCCFVWIQTRSITISQYIDGEEHTNQNNNLDDVNRLVLFDGFTLREKLLILLL